MVSAIKWHEQSLTIENLIDIFNTRINFVSELYQSLHSLNADIIERWEDKHNTRGYTNDLAVFYVFPTRELLDQHLAESDNLLKRINEFHADPEVAEFCQLNNFVITIEILDDIDPNTLQTHYKHVGYN